MNEKASHHDHVIKDGKFIGAFKEMYQEYEDLWYQSTQPNPYQDAAAFCTWNVSGSDQ